MWASSTLSACEPIIEMCLENTGLSICWAGKATGGKKVFSYWGILLILSVLQVLYSSASPRFIKVITECYFAWEGIWHVWLSWGESFILSCLSLETVISWVSALLLKVHAMHLPITQKLIKIILQLCYQTVCFVVFLVIHTYWLWSWFWWGFFWGFWFFFSWNDVNWKL